MPSWGASITATENNSIVGRLCASKREANSCGSLRSKRSFFLVTFLEGENEWWALADDFRTFLLTPGGSNVIFQQFTA